MLPARTPTDSGVMPAAAASSFASAAYRAQANPHPTYGSNGDSCLDATAAERLRVLQYWTPFIQLASDTVVFAPSCHRNPSVPPLQLRIAGWVHQLELDAFLGPYQILDHTGFPLACSQGDTGHCSFSNADLSPAARQVVAARNSMQAKVAASLRVVHHGETGVFVSPCMPLYLRFVPLCAVGSTSSTSCSECTLPQKELQISIVARTLNARAPTAAVRAPVPGAAGCTTVVLDVAPPSSCSSSSSSV